MSYQSAYFDRNQQAIRAMSDIAKGQTENTPTTVKGQLFSIRHAKDLLEQAPANATPVGKPAHTSNHVTHGMSQPILAKADAVEEVKTQTEPEANVAEVDLSKESAPETEAADTKAFKSSVSPEQHKAYATTESLDDEVSQNDRGLAIAMWLGSIVFLMIPAMLVLLKSDTSDYLKQQAREAINWTSTFLLGSIACMVLTLIVIGGPLQVLLSIAHVIFCLLGANAARSSKAYRVPMTWRPLQD